MFDKRTAIALLNVFVSEIIPCDDEKLLSNLIQTECFFNKNMADRLASILSMLYSDKNKKEWSTKINEGLNQFLKEEFSFDW